MPETASRPNSYKTGFIDSMDPIQSIQSNQSRLQAEFESLMAESEAFLYEIDPNWRELLRPWVQPRLVLCGTVLKKRRGRKPKPFACRACGDYRRHPLRPNSQFCSEVCANKGRWRGPRGGVRHTTKQCVVCSQPFAPRYKAKKLCSMACAAEYNRQRGFLQRAIPDPDQRKRRNRIDRERYRRIRGRRLQRLLRRICERDHWVCHICSRPIEASIAVRRTESPTIDHVIPLSRGGTDDESNLKAAHWSCNCRKGTKIGWKAVP